MSDQNTATDYHVSQIAKANQEAMKYRLKSRDARTRVAELEKQLGELAAERDTLATERDTLQAKLTTAPGEWQARYEQAQKSLLERDHLDAFAAVKGELHEKVDVKKLWAEAGYQPDGAAPDEARVSEWVKQAREAAPYLFRPDPGGSNGRALTRGVGSDRGIADGRTSGPSVRRSEMRDPAWMMRHQDLAAQAIKAGAIIED